ncbi:MAG: hypothetical protein WC225_00900 [Acholeplasmataceae bacterium]
MAKKVNKKKKTKPQAKEPITQPTPKKTSQPVTQKKKEKQPMTKNEALFFKVGIVVVVLAIIAAVIIMIVNTYLHQAPENPFEDYLHFDTTELVEMMKETDDPTIFGDQDYFYGKTQYEQFRTLLNSNTVFYFYFYRSDQINEDLKTLFESMENINDRPIIFIKTDAIRNLALFEDAGLMHLGLPKEEVNILLTFNTEPETLDGFFQIETDVAEMITILENM